MLTEIEELKALEGRFLLLDNWRLKISKLVFVDISKNEVTFQYTYEGEIRTVRTGGHVALAWVKRDDSRILSKEEEPIYKLKYGWVE